MPIPIETGDARPAPNGEQTAPETSPLEDLSTLQRELSKLIHDQLQLAALEARLAARSLMAMITASICIAALLVLAWAGLMAAAALSLISMGLRPAFALLLVTALTTVLALLLRGFTHRRSRNLGFPATLRTLKAAGPDTLNREIT